MHGTTAEYFLDLNRERTMEGLKVALAHGRKGGRRKKLIDADLPVARAMLKEETISVAENARRLGVTWTTVYQYFPAPRLDHDPGNSSPRNLKAFCQQCHMLHDRDEHRRQRWLTLRMRKALGDLFSEPYCL